MKTTLLSFMLGLIIVSPAISQCAHDPTVTPDDLILCPNTQDTLWTQVYDAYQWYKDGNPIPGATQQFLVVDYFSDAGSSFTVEATALACDEMSPTVLVDGWVFLPPVVMSSPNPVVFGGFYGAYYCNEDTVNLELMLPYTESIQWTLEGVDIPGANDPLLQVSADGFYSVSGAPQLCPDYIVSLGLDVGVGFLPPFEPDWPDYPDLVVNFHECLNCSTCIFYDMDSGMPIDTGTVWDPNSTTDDLNNVPYGFMYHVVCYDQNGCIGTDTVQFVIFGLNDGSNLDVQVYPNPASDFIYITSDLAGPFTAEVTDLAGKAILRRSVTTQLNIEEIPDGLYLLRIESGDAYLVRKIVIRH